MCFPLPVWTSFEVFLTVDLFAEIVSFICYLLVLFSFRTVVGGFIWSSSTVVSEQPVDCLQSDVLFWPLLLGFVHLFWLLVTFLCCIFSWNWVLLCWIYWNVPSFFFFSVNSNCVVITLKDQFSHLWLDPSHLLHLWPKPEDHLFLGVLRLVLLRTHHCIKKIVFLHLVLMYISPDCV